VRERLRGGVRRQLDLQRDVHQRHLRRGLSGRRIAHVHGQRLQSHFLLSDRGVWLQTLNRKCMTSPSRTT
jgi:hypothetical protein